MRRFAILVGLMGALAVPAAARADEQIEAGPACCRFTAAGYTMDQGERLTFLNSDVTGVQHDVVSRARAPEGNTALFSTPQIKQGENVFVEGSQYLTTGEYQFYCSLHSGMESKLTVTSAGTPQPRPGGGQGPPADGTAPGVALSAARNLKASKLARSRRIPVVATVDERADLVLTAFVGRTKVGSAKVELFPGTPTDVVVRVSRRGARALRSGRKLTLRAVATDAAGNAGRGSLARRLR
jgi:plastocyanin